MDWAAVEYMQSNGLAATSWPLFVPAVPTLLMENGLLPPVFLGMDEWMTSQLNVALIRSYVSHYNVLGLFM